MESFYKDKDQTYAEANHHSYASMSGRIMREAGVKEAFPVHFSRKYQEHEIEELVGEFQTAFTR